MKRLLPALVVLLLYSSSWAMPPSPEDYVQGSFGELYRFKLSVNGGYSMPWLLSRDRLRPSAHVEVSMHFRVWKALGLGIQYGNSWMHVSKGVFHGIDFDGDGASDKVPFRSGLRNEIYHITPFIRFGKPIYTEHIAFEPYVSFGGGWYHRQHNAGVLELRGTSSSGADLTGVLVPVRRLAIDRAGLNIGVGVNLHPTDHFGIGLGVRYHKIFRIADFDADGLHDDSLELLVPTMHFQLYF
ncbi:MAG: hypothetical protein V3S11_05440 [Elusimicrobiota bacterium]